MKRRNATRSALFTSIISLLLCVSMLVGTTFAWFTDTVVSGNNTIAAGNLDVELYHSDKGDSGYVDTQTELFNDVKLWEPGAVAYENFIVENKGTLALKYRMSVSFTNETVVDGHGLSEALKVAVVEGGFEGDRAQAQTLTNLVPLADFAVSGALEGDTKSQTYGVVIYWEPTENDNWFNMNNENQGKTLSIDLGINLFATQEMYEEDSFDETYDKGAPWTGEVGEVPAEADGVTTITSAGELAAFAADVNSGNTYLGKTVKLGADIDLNNIAWTPIGNSSNKFQGTFIGTGYTISNLYVTGSKGVGLFGYTFSGAHIEGVTIDGAYVSGNDYVGAVLGTGYLAANCLKNNTVKNAEIIAVPYLQANGEYDGGAKAGAVAGSAYNGNIIGNTAVNCTVTAYRDLGSIAGMVYAENRALTVSGNSADTVTLAYFDLNGAAYDGGKVNENMGDIVGRPDGGYGVTVAADNTAANVTREAEITWTEDGVQYIKDVDAGEVLLYDVTEASTLEKLTVPEGVTALGSKILEGNTTLKEVVIPASVTDFGGVAQADGKGASGGMFYKSAVEKITLPEGMTEIPDAAFNQALNLKEVNIPSTVTSIGIHAFAGTSLTELTVPATVTSIGFGAFRDMPNLESVVINTSANIPSYAFRNCGSLKTVVLTSEDVTFSAGQMIFSNKSSGQANDITVCVASEEVKERLEAADTANGYQIVVAQMVSDSASLKAAVDSGATEVYLLDGEYDVYGCGGKTLTISGSRNAVIKIVDDGESGLDACFDGSTVTFNGVTFNSTENTASYKGFTRMTGIYNDCAFVGEYCTSNYTHTFNNCYFETRGYIWTWGATEVTFNECEFGGDSRNILAHGGASTVLTINNCKFNAAEKGYTTWNPTWTAAVEIDPTGSNTYTINFTGENTINENYSGWTRVKDGSTGHTITGLN